MVRTRGLGRALGLVTGRGVGKGDRDDSDDTLQHRRPTAPARRQRVAVTTDHVDEPVIPALDVQDDPMEAPATVEDIPADIPVDAGVKVAKDQHQGFSGGPSDPFVLTAYADHVACSVWTGEAGHWTAAARSYLLHLLGCTLFANKSATNVHVVYLEDLCDLSMTEMYAWGVAALVQMYDQLNDASMSHSRQLDGYITLLQCWIYEHFPSVAESTTDQDYDEASPRACRWIATKKTIPYGEHREVWDFHVRSCYSGLLHWGLVAVYYRLERVVRQFGYTQTIPAPPIDSWVSYDDIYDRWMHYEDHIVPAGEVCVVPRACSSDYIDWFFRISHPFMTPGHALDPLPHGHAPQPRVVPQAPQMDIPRVPKLGASSTSAEEPRHAMEVCDDIAERLERHLSLGVVTPGSSTHEVIEESLRLVRSVTQDHLVYVRCRCKRRTDQA
ncbi:serine/threonine-protein phosphatase 7 long form homolog [Glycine max]|uniref:serine/threonine-protein phosphatase 7 long form homolog n=1 Tax=Glycine max TaxID=3847 RepID=UPI0003DE8EC3|nr:serine/threonine-protein phosphatase 7 long form homolog [Glycine max]|eukprot:XP_006590117.1 serine/threonine-protein phosphatase 7 long form homolog [Glycine max]